MALFVVFWGLLQLFASLYLMVEGSPASSPTMIQSCPKTVKPLKLSVLQGWQRCNDVRQELMVKLKSSDCPLTCSNIDPGLSMSEIGVKLGNIVNKLRCLYDLQTLENVASDELYTTVDNMNEIFFVISEITLRREICSPMTITPTNECFSLLKGTVDSVTIKNKDRVYVIGYQFTSELQTYLEKLYMEESSRT